MKELKDNHAAFPAPVYGILVLGILILAALVRVIHLQQLQSTPLFGFFTPDSHFFDTFALRLLEGDFFYKETIYLNPLYPFFLALVYGIFGHSVTAVAVSQIILDLFTCLFLYLICEKAFGNKIVGLLAAFAYGIYGISILYTGFLQDITLVIFLNTLLIFLLLNAKVKNRLLLWFLSGAVAALSMLLKASIALFLPILFLWLFIYAKDIDLRSRIRSVLFIIAGLIVILTPFAVRNYIIEERFSPFPVQGGINFYIGNNPDADGSYMHLPGIPDSPVEQAKASLRRAEQALNRPLTSKEASHYWFAKGLQFMKDDTSAYMRLLGRKFLLFWNKAEVDGNLNYYFCREHVPILQRPLLSFGVVAPFAVLGIIFAAWHRRADAYILILLVLTYVAAVTAYYVNSRYRLPCVPLLIIFAAYAIHYFFEMIRRMNVKPFLICILVLIALFVTSNRDMYGERIEKAFVTDYTNLGLVYNDKNMLDDATTMFKKALSLDPRYSGAHYHLGIAYDRKGMLDEAIKEYKKALTLGLSLDELHYNLGLAYFRQGYAEKAENQLREAIAVNPEYAEAYNNLGTVYYQKGMYADAATLYERAVMIEPGYSEARYNLGNVYFQQGNIENAITAYQKAIRVDPSLADAHYNLAVCYYRTGNIEKAMSHYAKAIEGGIDPDPAFLHKLDLGSR